MKGVYKFEVYIYRFGSLQGLFVEDSAVVESMMMREIIYHDILGKHSEIAIGIDEINTKLVSDEPEFVRLFEENVGSFGTNPIRDILYREEEERW